jgi:ketosteroid isomerase-like protein
MNANEQVVAAIYEDFFRGNVPGILARLSEDVRWEEWPDNRAQRAGVPWLQPRRGRAGAAEFFQSIAGFKFRDFRVRSTMVGGSQVAVDVAVEVEISPGGPVLREEEIHLWTLDEAGRVVRFRHYCDTAKHIAAARGES